MVKATDIAQVTESEQVARLMAQIESLSRDNEKLARDNADMASEMSRITSTLVAELASVRAERDRLIEKIILANQRFFGCKSERVMPDQLSLFNDMEAAADNSVEPVLDEVIINKPRRRGGKRRIDYSALEEVIIVHELPAYDRTCPQCNSALSEFNVEVSYTLRMVPAHLVAERHERAVYRCDTCCNANAKDGTTPSYILRANMPAMPLKGSFATPSLISYVINGKYVNALPLYRMEYDFLCLGADISRQNMANWVMRTYELWLSRMHARMKEKLLEGDVIHADETVVQVLKEPNREAKQQSRMWLFCAPACDNPLYVFEYHPTRSGEVAVRFLSGWSGTLMTDGYQPYFKLGSTICNTACLVHVRRKFAEIVKVAGGDIKCEEVGSVALEARRRIDKIFAIDSNFDNMDYETRRQKRAAQIRPLMEEFYIWAQARKLEAVPGMALDVALTYAITYWPYVMNVLDDGRLEFSNNLAERAIKPFVIGRKNFLFSDTPRGAEASAGIYSVVTTAKMNGLNPRKYIEWLLTEMPNAKDISDVNFLDSLMPWSASIPAELHLKPEVAAEAAKMADDPIVDIDPETLSDDK